MAADIPVPVEQVLGQLKTRGFDTGFRSPLRHFRGKLDSISGSMVQRGQMQSAKLEITYNFSQLEIIESTEPYPFPIAQVNIMHNTRDKSAMGVLGNSIDKIINAGAGDDIPQEKVKNQDFLIGKMQEWKVTPGHMMFDVDKKMETPRECWEVVWVEGFASTLVTSGTQIPIQAITQPTPTQQVNNPTTQALNLMDGKTIQQWNNAVFQDPLVKTGGGDLINSILSGTFIQAMEASGKVIKDANGIYHTIK